MSASQPRAHDLRRGDSLLSTRAKEAGRALLAPIVRLAVALHLTPNTITVLGFLVVAGAAVLVATGNLLAGAILLTAGSLLDAVDGALARATGAGSRFGSFLDSTLDRAAEAVLYGGIIAFYLAHSSQPTAPVLLALVALAGSFMVSYTRARAEGIGLTASVGLAPRMERLVLTFAGIGLAGLGVEIALIIALGIVALLSVATTVQRIWHVHRLSTVTPAVAPKQPAQENQPRG
ncbi:MAG TPA: CDP-alcohol phosphatidyltransferase family protein [Candidatus Limnocylindria bacterium]